MKLINFPLLMLVLAVAACAPKKDVRNAEEMHKERKTLVAEVNVEAGQLDSAYGINLSPTDLNTNTDESAKNTKWSNFTKDQQVDIQGRLAKVLNKLRRTQEISKHKNTKPFNDNGALAVMLRRGQIYRDSLERFLKTGTDGTIDTNPGPMKAIEGNKIIPTNGIIAPAK